MNKHLKIALLRRNGGLKVVKMLEARERMRDSDEVVYSTQQACATHRDENKNKGTIAASNMLRATNPFAGDKLASGRTKFFTALGELGSFQEFKMRVVRKK